MPKSLSKIAKSKKIKYFLISFVDLFGVLRSKLVPAQAINEMQKNGAQPASREDCLSRSDVIFSSEPISSDEIARIKKNALVVGLLEPFSEKEQLHNFAKANVSALSMEFIPRITKAQKMDVLSSQEVASGVIDRMDDLQAPKQAAAVSGQ